MAQTPFPVGFKQARKGFQSSFNPQDFLNQYLKGFTPVNTNAELEDAADGADQAPEGFKPVTSTTTMQGSTQQGGPGQLGDIGFGVTGEGKTILDPYGSYAGFMPKIEKRDGKFYVQDNRGYGPFAGKMHEVPEAMAKMQARKASMGMTRFLMPNPNPEQFAQTTTAGGITGTMMPSYVTGGGRIHNPQFSFSGALTPKSYNEWATAFQTQRDPNFDPMSKAGSEIVSSNYEISAQPHYALRLGMPINRDAFADKIKARTGMSDEDAQFRADWVIGNQLYRKNVAGGFAKPGTYARQGGGIPKGSTWGQVSRGGR